MEVYQVKVFLEVARHLSFTEAADALNLTQPAVSAKIKSLETELGTPLFYRLGRKIQLTEVGQFLLEEGTRLIDVENQLFAKVEEIKKGKFGNLKIGCTAAIANGWLPDILFQYRQQYPGIQAQCVVFDSAEFLYRAITSSQIDLGISDISFAEFSEISATPIAPIHYSLVVAANHPVANQSWLSLKELQKERWVMLNTGSPSRLVFESRITELGISLEEFSQVETVDTLSLMRTYMMQGHYLGFASNFEFKSECQLGMLVAIPLQEFALSGNVFLLLPKRLSESVSTHSSSQNRRSCNSNPIQKFIALVENSQEQQQASVYPQSTPVRLRSPSLIIRSNPLQRPETIDLAIGIQNSTIPMVTAGLVIQRLGLLEHFLPREGRYSSTQYRIHWCDFLTGAPIIQGLHSGQLDIGVLGDYPLLLSALQQNNAVSETRQTRLVSFISTNPDGSCNAVIVPNKSKLQSIEDLRGGVIAVPFSSSAHGMVMRSLNSVNLLNEVRLASLENSNITQPFGYPIQADGYAHFAPFHDIAYRQGKFRYLQSDKLNVLPAFHGVVVSAELAEQYPEVVIAYLKALSAAQYWYTITPSALSLISQWTTLDAEIVSQILSSVYHQNQSGRFFCEMKIRPDWIAQHIAELRLVPGNEGLETINLDRWIQTEFLHQVQT
ncbi:MULTISPECIES: LysR substrate-binding domain-containing protein [Cyanophyceae]|uniref:LysR substrate-binding domain-containing protein n=1 Tax=Cyanophyceae TaxID=3028117 RepID=UPI001681EA9D|nr:LysR substrate-binding domain-containing protein [Trichocoleus sp. FACHB-69]MBD1932286.1 LysR family transcriptional regulator [Trichocoleus sp. FACHB-69]